MTDGLQRLRLAMGALERRDREEAARILADLVRANPPLGGSWVSVVRLAQKAGETSIAVSAAERHAAAAGDRASRLLLGQILAMSGRHARAIAVGDELISQQPGDPAGWHFRGTCKAQLGETEAAESDLRRAVDLLGASPAAAWPWLAIAEGKTFQPDDPDAASIAAALERLPMTPDTAEARSVLGYAHGKALDDLGETDRAFAAYAAGAAIARAAKRVDMDAMDRFVDQATGFDRAMLDRLPRGPENERRPIFVMGLPRSGTTLVEQILASHDEVSDGAELNLFGTSAFALPDLSPATIETWSRSRPGGFEDIARAYLHLLDERFGPEGRIVDKTLNHSRFLGLIHAVLPAARVVWMRRDPAATAWSCFSTRFAAGVDWSWSLQDIGRYFRGEDRLHAHWTELLGDVVLTVPYEEFVRDPSAWIPRILEHVGLSPQDDMQDFHKTRRAVATSSFAQVRQPIHTRAVEGWRRYEPHMAPFFEAYGKGQVG